MLRIITLLSLCVATGFTPLGLRPTTHTLEASSSIKVHGTSTLHDWTMVMKQASGEATFEMNETGLTISRVFISLNAEDLKSEYALMDKNAYEALKTEKFPKITFDLSQVHGITHSGSAYQVDASGLVSMAGAMKTVRMTVVCHVGKDGTIQITGKKAMKMTDFGIEPPEVMFGTITTGDDIVIDFDARFLPNGHS
ncbi:MAG: YceI family protein [Bacteroidia bacterium]|nr:YceI family protein [Bacteroidia bacterium]